jgi:peptide chain release factor 2
MYQRYALQNHLRFEILDFLEAEPAGIKSATVLVSGSMAFGMLRSEAGVHRLVRISPFDANARRHTSFASVFVTAEVTQDVNIQINPVDLRIDVYRSGGKGGQGVNTTDSAVRITHLPTNIVVVCQKERSQIKNKETAMKVLYSRLYERHLQAEKEKLAAVEDSKQEITWGSQMRSYVLHPYKMVKDHRTGVSVSTAEQVLDGDLGLFIQAYLKCKTTGVWSRNKEEMA